MRKYVAVATAMIAMAVLVPVWLLPDVARAVTANGKPTVTPAPATTGNISQYTVGRFKSSKSEYVVACSLTFPAGTNVSQATLTSQAGTVTVTGQTLTVTLALPTPIGTNSQFYITLGNIINTTTPGTYNIPDITFWTSATADGASPSSSIVTLGTNGNFTITTAPYLWMTITTPDASQTVDFGAVDPGVLSGARTVSVYVNSSLPCTITRALTGSVTPLGLTVAGSATGAKAAGAATYTDTYQIQPAWTTAPGPWSASVQYTVTQ